LDLLIALFPPCSSLYSLKVARKFDCRRDILLLRSLVATREQDHKLFASTNEVHAIAGTVVDPHLRYATADGPRVAGIADRKAANSGIDAGSRSIITQVCQPTREDLGLANFDRGGIYPIGYDASRRA
jgi:hypothetical protein